MPKRLLLTGAAGSIGVHTIAHIFHNTDWEIVGLDSFKHKGWVDRITEVCLDHPDWKDRLTMITHDLNSPISPMTKDRIGDIDYIISMASLSDVQASIENPAEFIQNNIAVILNTLEYAREIKPKVFLQVSTDEVYGACHRTAAHPEWSPIVPSNPYSASKAAQESICISYWRSYALPLVITNTMNNFGEMQQSSKFPAMVQKLIESDQEVLIHGKEGEIGTRYYLHSRNHADALLYILTNLPPHLHQDGEIDRPDRYNVVGDVQLDNLELAQLIARLMGKQLKYRLEDFHATRPGHDRHYGLNGDKLKGLGWQPPLSFEESLRNTIEWQQQHPEWLKH